MIADGTPTPSEASRWDQAKNTHHADQASAAACEMAAILGGMMKDLLSNGFTRDEAIRIVLQNQEHDFQLGRLDDKSP